MAQVTRTVLGQSKYHTIIGNMTPISGNAFSCSVVCVGPVLNDTSTLGPQSASNALPAMRAVKDDYIAQLDEITVNTSDNLYVGGNKVGYVTLGGNDNITLVANGKILRPNINVTGTPKVNVLVVGGGGGGGLGGGGGGEVVEQTEVSIGNTTAVTVGEGGTPGNDYLGTETKGGTGGTSSFGSVSASGGGGGGVYQHTIAPGAYKNDELGLISLSVDGINRVTIADKNLGATTKYRPDLAVPTGLTQSNCGNFYQWGNNYGFPYENAQNTNGYRVDASEYGPGNYYSSSTFITQTNYRDSSHNDNLRGGTTGTVEAMQGPCPEGFHVPTKTELEQLATMLNSSVFVGLYDDLTARRVFTLNPFTGYLVADGDGGIDGELNYSGTGSSGYTGRASSTSVNGTPYCLGFNGYANTIAVSTYGSGDAISVRPFKNTPVVPDDDSVWDKLTDRRPPVPIGL